MNEHSNVQISMKITFLARIKRYLNCGYYPKYLFRIHFPSLQGFASKTMSSNTACVSPNSQEYSNAHLFAYK